MFIFYLDKEANVAKKLAMEKPNNITIMFFVIIHNKFKKIVFLI